MMKKTLIITAILTLAMRLTAQETLAPLAPICLNLPVTDHSPSTLAQSPIVHEEGEEEYEYKERTMTIWPRWEDNEYNVTVGAPIVTTKPFSKSETIYNFTSLMLLEGDKITKIGYTGYNPGAEVERHVIVWMQKIDTSTNRSEWNSSYLPQMIKLPIVTTCKGGDCNRHLLKVCTFIMGRNTSNEACFNAIAHSE